MTPTRIRAASPERREPGATPVYKAPGGARIIRVFDTAVMFNDLVEVDFTRGLDGSVSLKRAPAGPVWIEFEDHTIANGTTKVSNLGALKYADELRPDQIGPGVLAGPIDFAGYAIYTPPASPSIGDRILAALSDRIQEDARDHAREQARKLAESAAHADPDLDRTALAKTQAAARRHIEAAYITNAIEKVVRQLAHFKDLPTGEQIADRILGYFSSKNAAAAASVVSPDSKP